MTYLIAHKVRGEPAFDIAERMRCPKCNGTGNDDCIECDDFGYWWILLTCGYRAYPYWSISLDCLMHDTKETFEQIDPARTLDEVPEMPDDLPDLFACNDHNHKIIDDGAGKSLLARLGLLRKVEPLKRRI